MNSSLSSHVYQTVKRGVKIINVDPAKRLIEAETRNGEVISVNAYSYTPVFRWPMSGERWVVKEENGSWYLDGIYEAQEETIGTEVKPEPGDAVISSSSGRILVNRQGELSFLRELSTYAELIAADEPINGWDLQDASGAASLAATYGGVALKHLNEVTSGDISTPLYPGAKAIHFSGKPDAGASTETATALITYAHMTAEIWVRIDADADRFGACLFIGKNSATFEGFGMGFGGSSFGNANSEANYLSHVKPGITFNAGSGASNLASNAPSNRNIYQLPTGWHHLCWRTQQNGTIASELFVDGQLVCIVEQSSESGWQNHTSAERTFVGNYLTEGSTAGPNSTGILFAHAYLYNKRLSNSAIRARSTLVELLNA